MLKDDHGEQSPTMYEIKGMVLDQILDSELCCSAMTRVTGKFQITLPKKLVDAYGINIGDEVQLVASGEVIAIVLAGAGKPRLSLEERLRLFDEATRRHSARERLPTSSTSEDRGWTRDELYDRGRTR
jgi:bifunctional DNA-binding transcriptional regulator/antitoxin component of YhaV-PrlF toxin-antitoxin module